jgi:hypothetical protein
MPARYVAEAGMVWAQQRLIATPTWNGGSSKLSVGGKDYTAVVTVTPTCAAAPCPPRTIRSKVIY